MDVLTRARLGLGVAIAAAWFMVLAGCATQRAQTPPAPTDLTRAVPVVESSSERAPDPAPSTVELIGPDDPDIQAAMNAWKASGQAPIIRKDEFIQYPFGLTEAILTCQPLRICDIELEPGEDILNVSLGDAGRWLASPAFSGERETLTPHILVKPTEYGIATNAVITTTRRTYYLALVSNAKGETGHVRRVKFYYPTDLIQQANGLFRAKMAQRKQDQETTVARLSRVALESLNFGYQIEGDGVPWRPLRVFDDGTHVYIQMPEAMRVTEAPALLVQTRSGDAALVNYRLRHHYYVVDKLFETAILIVGVGDRQERVTIRHAAGRR